jgi:hypothetical protein
VFHPSYADEEDYLDGFVESRVQRIREDEAVGLTHPGDVPAERYLALWRDPKLPPEEKKELVLESLKSGCLIVEDEGQMWRL